MGASVEKMSSRTGEDAERMQQPAAGEEIDSATCRYALNTRNKTLPR
jgi:hypothetical protein